MKTLAFALALAGSLVTGNAFAKGPVCNYAAGETLLSGPYTDISFTNCPEGLLRNLACKYQKTTQLYACSDASGHITRSGILTVTWRINE